MGEKIVVGPYNRGLRNDVTPFNIDNDSFPVLINAYQWRGRVKRKRGTSLLGRLQRYIGTTDGAGNLMITLPREIIANPNFIGVGISFFVIGTDIFTDPGTANPPNPTVLITNGAGAGTLDRTTGILTITGSIALTPVIFFPGLPVMGLEDFAPPPPAFPRTIGFDTTYAYNISPVFPYAITDVSFYKNPPVDAVNLPGYVPKATLPINLSTPITWNGQDYQQFWTTNYQGAMWATNGITVPFSPTNVGMQFNTITAVAIVAGGPPAIVTITTTTNHNLIIGDFVFLNEIVGMTGINFQSGYVIGVPAANQITVELPFATVAGAFASGGIVQYLTNRLAATSTVDCIRWYDGDPTNGLVPPTFTGGLGWVNFTPPLSQGPFSIADLPARQYYLVGARMLFPFKDRLLAIGPVVQASTGPSIYLQDTVIYSQNGTPYYTASYTNSPNAAVDTPASATNVFHPILVPVNQTATSTAWFEDQTGFGGFITAGVDQPITTTAPNKDVLILGFTTIQTRLVYSGNDLVPFNFFIINSELGSGSTFSSITMDKGVLARGERGFILTGQVEAARNDLEIPDEVFQISLLNNGSERVTAQRDFINEWIYETYPVNTPALTSGKFPNQTLQYNYRDNSWAIFRESYTHYGSFRKQTGFTWATVGTVYPTWNSWNQPWNAGASTLLQPEVIAGNQQGFIMVRDDGTDEGNSLSIQNIATSIVTSPNHGLNSGDYIVISGALGTVGALVNGKIFSVSTPITTNSFGLNPPIPAGTYLGGGLIKRMYVPFIQSKQFPQAWGMSRKTRLGPQQYLLTTTDKAQISLLIYLSQDATNPYNAGPIVPMPNTINNALIYSTVLYTCTESSNLGLTPANTNLQMISNINNIGTDAQMRDVNFNNQFEEIEIHGMILDCSSAGVLA